MAIGFLEDNYSISGEQDLTMQFLRKHPRWLALALILIIGGPLLLWSGRSVTSGVGFYDGLDMDPGEIPDVLADPGDSVLYSIEPTDNVSWGSMLKPFNVAEYNVLGTLHLNRQQALDLAHQIQPDLEAYSKLRREHPGAVESSGCFDPHHVLEINYWGHVYDFVICFDCGEVHTYKDRTIRLEFILPTASGTPFNKVLADAHLPYPKPWH